LKKGKTGGGSLPEFSPLSQKFFEAMDDDFNTPQAVAVLFDLSRSINELMASADGASAQTLQEVAAFFDDSFGQVLGLAHTSSTDLSHAGDLEPSLVEMLINARKEARTNKLWGLSDKIRDELKKLGIVLEDTKDGTTWKRA
jgi:cysteinyl-tRNA synthetase